ncbi:hypothetical protein [Bradyrhizobium sp. USDA 3315]|nr:hypothetical protein AOQ73_04665 [Bradyrhizobium pachyrhizi]OMI05916.1 hypothetical protein BSN85_23565 [Bradyrhizobium brasilense]
MDDLLKRADRAIEDSYRVKEEAIEHLIRAQRVAREVRATIVRAESARSRYRQLGLETAERQGAFQENPAGTSPSDQRD